MNVQAQQMDYLRMVVLNVELYFTQTVLLRLLVKTFSNRCDYVESTY